MSNDDMQPVDESQELVDEISTTTETSNDDQEMVDEWVVEIEGRLDNSHATRCPSLSNIEDIPSIIGNWQCWDDFGASFIPEPLKWIFVACMTQYFGLNVRSYIVYMQKKVHLAWSYYCGVDQFRNAENSKHFIEHLLVHSCFLIFSMILLSGENELRDRWFEIINKDEPKGLSRFDIQTIIDFMDQEEMRTSGYMLTMKYQIPWFIVEAVYTELSNISTLFAPPIHKIAYLFCCGFSPASFDKFDEDCTVPEDGFKHLLHIFHWSRTPDGEYVNDLTIEKWFGEFHIPSATELQLSQTVFIKDEDGTIDVSYSDRRVMQLTPWELYNYSPKLYESLLRFEGLYSIQCGCLFSSYVTCMASLLKTEEDVRVLRVNHIIPSTSFNDKDVFRCLQELRTLIDDSLLLPNELIILEEKVITHHKKSAYRVYGEFKKRYCSNPWIIISVVAGICLFVLTFIQTIYGTLSYYKQ